MADADQVENRSFDCKQVLFGMLHALNSEPVLYHPNDATTSLSTKDLPKLLCPYERNLTGTSINDEVNMGIKKYMYCLVLSLVYDQTLELSSRQR